MSATFLMDGLLATHAPALPQAWAMQLTVPLGWALVLALLGAVLGARLALPARRLLVAALALWTLLPGPWSPHYWLGLAFQAPSLSAMLLCLVFLRRLLYPARSGLLAAASAQAAPQGGAGQELLLVTSVLLGYALLLDTFAVLPLQLYAWGFSPLLLLSLLALSLWPWVSHGVARGPRSLAQWLAPAALLLFAATRLPSGNVWDAVLDPWLWLLLQVALLRRLYARCR